VHTTNPLFHHAFTRARSRVVGLLVAAAAAVAVIGGAGVIAAAPASAHSPAVTANCSTLSVNLTSYVASSSKSNTVAVTINGATQNFSFQTSFAKTFTFASAVVNNPYEVKVTAWDAPSNPSYSPDITGTTANCVPPVTKDASAAVVLTPAACATPASVMPGAIVNATWSSTKQTSGPGSYSYTATAASGHEFADGTTTQSFSGQLAGPTGYQGKNADQPCYEAPAAAAVVVTQATCSAPATATPGDVTNATWSSTETISGPGDYGFTATAAATHTFASGEATESFSGQLAGPIAAQSSNPDAPCYTAPAKPVVTPTAPPTSTAVPAAPTAQAGSQLAETGSDVLVPLTAVGLLLAAGAAFLIGSRLRGRRQN
jgi:hypothetical protein